MRLKTSLTPTPDFESKRTSSGGVLWNSAAAFSPLCPKGRYNWLQFKIKRTRPGGVWWASAAALFPLCPKVDFK